MKILVVEDDEVLAHAIGRSLTAQGYTVDVVSNGLVDADDALGGHYDLWVIDVDSSCLDESTLCQTLRSRGIHLPILLMTALEATSDRSRAWDVGGDGYLTKPLNFAELCDRVRSLLHPEEQPDRSLLAVGALCLDPESHRVTYEGVPLSLTPKEYSLLELFLGYPGRFFSRGQLMEHLWTYSDDVPQEESVKVHIQGLRQKLKLAGALDWIENIYELGYRLQPQVSVGSPTDAIAESVPVEVSATFISSNPESESTTALISPSTVEQFEYGLQLLWRQYRDRIAKRLALLDRTINAIQSGFLPDELHQRASQAAHKLSGVLGMFQRDDGTLLVREIEAILLQTRVGSLQGNRLRSLVQELRQRLNLDESLDDTLSGLEPDVWGSVEMEGAEPHGERLNGRSRASEKSGWSILIVDDDPLFLATLRPMLEPWGIQMTGLADPLQLWEVLPTVKPNLLVLDVEMPQCNGIELCQAVRQAPEWQTLPILFLTPHYEPLMIQRIFAAGADDFVTKPIVGAEFLSRIVTRLERLSLLQTFTTKDPITGLANQSQSQRSLEALMQSSINPVGLVLLEISDLQSIHIQYGFSMGAEILRQWSQTLRKALSSDAILGYWGEGEFIIGLPCCQKSHLGDRLVPLLTQLRSQVFTYLDGTPFQVQFRMAIVEYPTEGQTVLSLYQRAQNQLAQSQ